MQGVKVMIKEVVRPPLVAAGEVAAGGFTKVQTLTLNCWRGGCRWLY
jgi:hypothetical protein